MQKVFYKSKCGNEYISEHFQYKEFACHDGTDRFLLDTDMIPVIEKYREYEERSQRINSAFRTILYNKRIGGASSSLHLHGQAFDLQFYKTERIPNIDTMCAFFNTLKVNGIIKYSWGVHIDLRKYVYHATNTGKRLEFKKINIPLDKTLRKGSKTNDVGVLQFLLKQEGYDLEIDCIFGRKTENAVRHYQETRNLRLIDGIVGKETWGNLIK